MTGLKCWDASGNVIFDTSFSSWFLLSDDNVVGTNESATLTFPDRAGMQAAVSESPLYDAFSLGFGMGTLLLTKHTIDISYASGFPVVTLTPYMHHNVFGGNANIPMKIYVYGYYP